jgi:tRNA nucleotidyltransferase/poly(A) polymerase
MQLAAKHMKKISGERQRDELFKLLETRCVHAGFGFLLEIGVFQECFPLFAHESVALVSALSRLLDGFAINQMFDYLSATLAEERTVKALVYLYMLMDPQPEAIDTLVSFYALSNRERAFLTQLRAGNDYLRTVDSGISSLTPREIYRYYRKTNNAGVASCLVALANSENTAGTQVLHQLINAYFEENDRYINVSPLLNGNDLVRLFHLAPGPQFKELLESLKEAQAMGEVTSISQAEQFIAQQLK